MSDGFEHIGEGLAALFQGLADISTNVFAFSLGQQAGEGLAGAASYGASGKNPVTDADAFLAKAFRASTVLPPADLAAKMLDPDVDFIDPETAQPAADPFGLKDTLKAQTRKPGQ